MDARKLALLALATALLSLAQTPMISAPPGTAVSSLPPYLSVGGKFLVSSDNSYVATLPSTSGTPFPSWTATSTATGTAAALTNGNVTYTVGATSAFLGEPSHIISIEAVLGAGTTTSAAGYLAGIYMCDATNSKIYIVSRSINGSVVPQLRFNTETFAGTCAAMGNPGSSSDTYLSTLTGALSHLKLSVSGTTLTAAYSLDGGISFISLGTATVGTIGKVGITAFAGVGNYISVAVN